VSSPRVSTPASEKCAGKEHAGGFVVIGRSTERMVSESPDARFILAAGGQPDLYCKRIPSNPVGARRPGARAT